MVIKIWSIYKSFGGKVVLNGVNIEVDKGEIFALLARNAGGKSTLIKIISGLIKPDSGEILILGRTPNYPDVFKALSVLLDPPSFYPQLSVSENIDYFKKIHEIEEIPEIELRLNGYTDKKVNQLSRGTVKKIGLAFALWKNAQVYLLDEPFAHLDPVAREFISNRIRYLSNNNRTVLFTTHSREMIKLCSRVGILENGKIDFVGIPEDKRVKEFFESDQV